MTSAAPSSSVPGQPPLVADALRAVSKYWWLWLVAGIFWIIVALVVLQFDQASIKTVGILIGIMFLVSAAQQAMIGALTQSGWKWLFYAFAVLFAAAGIVSLIRPKNTFAGVADILGFLFLIVGTFWIIEAFGEREFNPFWWFGLISGIALIVLAFWTGGQFFIHKAYVLLVFAGIWSLFHGVNDIFRAFQIRELSRGVRER
jgi:uncharacterized membrane protein HdeD (DUF308 family)